jgi:DNA-binding CsgD family transcriptional regulator
MEQMLVVVDRELRIVYISDSFSRFTGFLVGQTFNENQLSQLPNLLFDISLIKEHILGTFKDKIKRQIFCPITKDDITKIANFTFGCVVNPETNNVIGAIIYVQRFNMIEKLEMFPNNSQPPEAHANINYITPSVTRDGKLISAPNLSQKITLTQREEKVIFLLLQKCSSREIAEILSKLENTAITKDAIDKLITNQLQKKFNVANRNMLAEQLIKLNYHKLIPDIFTQNFTRVYFLLD